MLSSQTAYGLLISLALILPCSAYLEPPPAGVEAAADTIASCSAWITISDKDTCESIVKSNAIDLSSFLRYVRFTDRHDWKIIPMLISVRTRRSLPPASCGSGRPTALKTITDSRQHQSQVDHQPHPHQRKTEYVRPHQLSQGSCQIAQSFTSSSLVIRAAVWPICIR